MAWGPGGGLDGLGYDPLPLHQHTPHAGQKQLTGGPRPACRKLWQGSACDVLVVPDSCVGLMKVPITTVTGPLVGMPVSTQCCANCLLIMKSSEHIQPLSGCL